MLFFTLSAFFFLCCIDNLKAQQQITPQPQSPEQEAYMKTIRERWNNALGTFQIQIVNSRISPQIDAVIIERIEAARKDEEVVYFPLRESVRVMVLPKSQISSVGFEKIETYKYVQE
jgi:hypothetical protein